MPQNEDNRIDALSQKYRDALREINKLRDQIKNRSSNETTTETISHSIQGLELLTLRVSANGKIEYINRAFSRFFKIKKESLIGKDFNIIYRLNNQPLLEKITVIDNESTKIIETVDENGDHFKIKLTKSEGVMDVIIENVTDQHRFKEYVKKYISLDLTSLSDEDLTTFKFPERRLMTVSFTNLRGFTQMSEKLIPEQVRKIMNAYLDTTIKAIEQNRATVDKIIGDEVMALYGAPKYYRDHALRAIKTALEQLDNLAAIREQFNKAGKTIPGAGIGINTGEMVVGSMGSATRKDYTVMGTAVNIAARLAKLAHEDEILMTENTLNDIAKELPTDWVIQEGKDTPPDHSIFGQESNGIYALRENAGKSMILGKKNRALLSFKYLFAYKVKGLDNLIPILSVRELEVPEQDYLQDEALKYFDGVRYFGKYKLQESLGKGGMGEVWKAQDPFGNIVAVKTLLAGDQASKTQLERFIKEAEIMSQLQHHGICRIHEVGESDGINYIAMEYLDGATLSRVLEYKSKSSDKPRIECDTTQELDLNSIMKSIELNQKEELKRKRHKRLSVTQTQEYNILPIQQAISIIIEVCSAIHFAHEHGIYHRDIKPQNIMIRNDGSPVIMDFGIAKMNTPDATENVSVQGQIFGTIEYMAPEQAISSESVDEKADVYSIGAVLYQIITGKKHFQSNKNVLDDLRQLATHEPVPPRFYNKNIDADLEAVVLMALRPNPKERYASAKRLAEDLKRYQAGEPVRAKAPTIAYKVKKTIQRNKIPFVLSCALILLFMTIGGLILLERRLQEGNWVRIYGQNFMGPKASIDEFEFRQGDMKKPAESFSLTAQGLRLKEFQWCLLRNIRLSSDVRVVMNVVFGEDINALSVFINGKDEPQTSMFHLPPSYSIQCAGYSGTLDILGKNFGGATIPTNISNSSFVKPNQPVRVELQRLQNKLSLKINGKETLVYHDFLPHRERGHNRIGFICYSEGVYLKSIDVYRLSLPEKASPLIAGDALYANGDLKQAIDEYLTVAEDYAGREVAELALMKAYIIASKHEAEFGHYADPIKADFYNLYPNSVYRARMLEMEVLIAWEVGNYSNALKNLEDIYRIDPNSRIVSQLRHDSLDADIAGKLVTFFHKTKSLNSLDIKPLSNIPLSTLAGLKLERFQAARLGITNLEPLRGMPLQWLAIPENKIDDISPLTGMPLRFLYAGSNNITSLAALNGAPLEVLLLNNNKLTNLEPIRGAPINRLVLISNQLTDISPLEGMPLKLADLSYNSITDIAPLKSKSLSNLSVADNQITSLQPLRGLPLTYLTVKRNLIEDLEPISKCPLKTLLIDNNRIKSLAPLVGMEMDYLSIGYNPLESIEPLNRISVRGVNLKSALNGLLPPLHNQTIKSMDISQNNLKSIYPISGLKLERLDCSNNRISDLAPLKGMPLTNLLCEGNRITSLGPFLKSPPDTFYFDSPTLPSACYKEAYERWSGNPDWTHNVYYAKVMYYIKQNYISNLKQMAVNNRGHYYLHIPKKMTWPQAARFCRKLGGHLVTVSSPEEQTALFTALQNHHGAFIGLHKKEGKTVWENGEPLSYTSRLQKGRTNEIYYQVIGANHNQAWITVHQFDKLKGFIIEWDK